MMPGVNLGKLVSLEVHDRLKNVKIKKNTIQCRNGHALYRWKDKEKNFQQANYSSIWNYD